MALNKITLIWFTLDGFLVTFFNLPSELGIKRHFALGNGAKIRS